MTKARSESGTANRLDLRTIDALLVARRFWLAFPPEIERRFEADTSSSRRRRLVVQNLLVLVVFNLFGLLDRVVLSDAMPMVMVWRNGIFTVVMLMLTFGIHHSRTAFMRESLVTLSGIWMAVVSVVLISLSSNPLRFEYGVGLAPIILFVIAVQRLRFTYSIFISIAFALLFILSLKLALVQTSYMAAPLSIMLTVMLLALMAGHGIESEQRREYLRALGEMVRRESFEQLSERDALTGIRNRRAMEQNLSQFVESRPGDELAVIFADIDKFKLYNDYFGHLAGDDCLRRVAGVLQAEARGHDDYLFRYGGEEFVAILHGSGLDNAIKVAERMCKAVSNAGIPHSWPTQRSVVSLSLGVAAARVSSESDVASLLKKADEALYQAKESGRNRVMPKPAEPRKTNRKKVPASMPT